MDEQEMEERNREPAFVPRAATSPESNDADRPKKKHKIDETKEEKRKRRAAKLAADLRKTNQDIMSKALSRVRLPMIYRGGALRLTRTPGRDRVNTVRLEELIHPNELEAAFVFAFCIAGPVFFQNFPLKTTSNHRLDCPVVGRLSQEDFERVEGASHLGYKDLYGANLHMFHPEMPSSGCAHSKILILVYPGFMRLVITSANLDTEYGDNHYYIQDFPALSLQAARTYEEPKFQTDLCAHIQDLGCPKEFWRPYLKDNVYDFTEAKVHLVTSKPGSHSQENSETYGQLRLRNIVRHHILSDDDVPKMEFEVCVGSVGRLENETFLKNMLESCSGGLQKHVETQPALKVVFPTVADGSGQIASHIQDFPALPNAMKEIFHHYKSKDLGCLFHMKLILALRAGQPNDLPLYAYVGSHNFSKNAWGSAVPQKDKRAKKEGWGELRLEGMANFECGVVVPGEWIVPMLETGEWEELVPYVRPSPENRYRPGERAFKRLPQEDMEKLMTLGGAGGMGSIQLMPSGAFDAFGSDASGPRLASASAAEMLCILTCNGIRNILSIHT
ncbi:tyrosyl-DNA phosphodiesterase-domain-containing protein [Roridomyces roridus]|uniref:Tyrosyl-DNA phosphodiesterase-domain-containing protein n=1 Tax=Roridomyces roridus TaxID=1738132 RepID=A0AAD7AZR9_9AGAR|nr:tyrosyl-DNA phosphodiesterase-domain-containing protein [Roridomyces roridus]